MPPYRKHIMYGTIWGPESARPAASVANGAIYYNTTASAWQISNGTSWSNLGGSGGMEQHANEYHTPDMALASDLTTHTGAAVPHSGHEQTANKGAANGYASLGADGLVPSAQLPASGSDPWVVLKKNADQLVSTTTPAAVTGLAFAPAANKTYLVQAYLLLRTAATATGARPGFNWPSGLTDGGAVMRAASSVTAFASRIWGAKTANLTAASTGLTTTADSYLAIGEALVITGASPSGSFAVTLGSETAGTNAPCKAGSILMYREL